MPTDFGFRFSTYLALGLACATLGYSEFLYLPSVTAFTVAVLGMLVVAFRRDGRNEMSLATANRVGLVIGIATIAYVAFQIFRPGDTLLDRLPFPAGMLPYLGPVLMVLIVAKLFRPKHVGDWWTMHGVGLTVVCLACVMEDDTPLAILVTAYLVVGVWSLMLFYFRRGGGGVPSVPRTTEPNSMEWFLEWAFGFLYGRGRGETVEEVSPRVVSAADAPPRSRFGGIRARRPMSYLAAAAAAGFLLFFLTPRTDTPHWSLSSYREVGFNTDEQAPDLNKTGDLKDNRDRAFEVVVRNPDGSPKVDLDPGQRWRGAAFVNYQGGKWETQRAIRGQLVAISVLNRPSTVPGSVVFRQAVEAAGSEAFVIDFELNGKRKDPVIADPAWWGPGVPSPLSTKGGTERSWFQYGDGTFMPPGGRIHAKQYRQVLRPAAEPDLGPAFQLQRGVAVTDAVAVGLDRPQPERRLSTEDQYYLGTVDHLRFNPLPRVRTWTEALIEKLVASGGLPRDLAARYVPADGTFPVADFEAVARAVSRHFADSGEFSYGTENTRVDKTLDPVEDFLLHTKSGSCEWYATALTLSLRSVGIPAQCVLGFKGCEHEEDGRYTIRQDNAHAWVEVLIPRPLPAGMPIANEVDAFRNPLDPPTKAWHWLTLDPTPGSDTLTNQGTGISGLWGSFRAWWLAFFNDFVVRYDPERRERAAAAVEKWFTANWRALLVGGLGLASLGVLALIVPRLRNRAGGAAAAFDPVPVWYRRFLTAAAAAGFVPAGGETPGEFADRVAAVVPAAGEAVRTLTETLYRVRYAAEPVPPPEVLAPHVAVVESVLTAVGPTPGE